MQAPELQKLLVNRFGLTESQAEKLGASLPQRTFSKGEFVLHKGDVCNHSFFVERGLLRSYTIDAHGKEHVIQFACEGWIMTDRSSTYFHEPSELFIDAIEPTTAVLLDEDFVHRGAEMNPAIRDHNDKALHAHIRQLQGRINMLLGATAEERYLHFIRIYPNLTLRVPQWMIASYLGITPESLSRVRRELAEKHVKIPKSKDTAIRTQKEA